MTAQNTTTAQEETTIIHIAVMNNGVISHDDDQGLPGVYEAEVQGPMSPEAVRAAMDEFHNDQGIEVLDDFVIIPFDPDTGEILEESEESDGTDLPNASCTKLTDDEMRLYRVKVLAELDGLSTEIDTVTVVADSEAKANQLAYDLLWESGMSVAGAKARYVTEDAT